MIPFKFRYFFCLIFKKKNWIIDMPDKNVEEQDSKFISFIVYQAKTLYTTCIVQ
jgi:hypothetical protein